MRSGVGYVTLSIIVQLEFKPCAHVLIGGNRSTLAFFNRSRHGCMLRAVSIVVFLGMAAGGIVQFATGNLFSPSPWAITVQVGAALLLLWARRAFGRRSFHPAANPTEGGLVTSGPYRYIRHPIYTAFSLFSLAGVAAHWSWVSGLLGGLVVGCGLVRIYCEEVLVTARYPEYRQYAATTWRMIPYVF
jgi:protein-S-isoprenylcysteine O-methyltransferase Ste14